MSLHPHEDVTEVLVGVDAVQLAGGYDGLKDREVLTGLVVPNEEKVLATKRHDS